MTFDAVPTDHRESQYSNGGAVQVAPPSAFPRRFVNSVVDFGQIVIVDADRVDSKKDKFLRLSEEWKAATLNTSSFHEIISHRAYRAIINMGWDAVPFMLDELAKSPAHWFYALRKITKANVIPKSSPGNFEKMTDAWLSWGKQHGYI